MQLELATLGLLDQGSAEVAINGALRAAVRDTEERGDDEKPREVTIKIRLVKLDSGAITALATASTKIPPYTTKKTICETVTDGRGRPTLKFSEVNPGNPHQQPLPDTV